MANQKLLDDFFKNFEDKSKQGRIDSVKATIRYLAHKKYYDKNVALIDSVVKKLFSAEECVPEYFNNQHFLENAIKNNFEKEVHTIELTEYEIELMIKSLIPRLYPGIE